ncbi:hypothetical protein MCELHM10_03312 [Paracoccaceae bacterium]|jgi:hypothetical protein
MVRAFWFFLSFWSFGCIAVFVRLALGMDTDLIPKQAIGLLVVGWFFGAFYLTSWLSGKETLRFDGSDLCLVHQAFGLKRRRRFRLAEIQQATVEPRPIWVTPMLLDLPFAIARQYGSIGFTYRGRRVLLLPGLGQAQAALILGWINEHLPGHQSTKNSALL